MNLYSIGDKTMKNKVDKKSKAINKRHSAWKKRLSGHVQHIISILNEFGCDTHSPSINIMEFSAEPYVKLHD